jgi:plasmid stabilization system protein ParE
MVKFKIEWSKEARLDLLDILEFYVKRNGSSLYSIKLNSQINNSIKSLVRNPSLGKLTEYKAVRALITGDYQIIYEVFDGLLLILMIWDCRRNPEDKVIDTRIK